jgi:hypothetical protein
VIYPAEVEGLTKVLSARDIRADRRQFIWETSAQIFWDLLSWHATISRDLLLTIWW